MPALIITPDMSAETCEGATGWARGSQTWSGIAPAFVPKPISKRTNTTSRPAGDRLSRGDHWKVLWMGLSGFAGAFDPSLGAHLILAGPRADGVEDDPEAAQVFAECQIQWEALPADVRRHVHLANLPTADHDENAAITNARGPSWSARKRAALSL